MATVFGRNDLITQHSQPGQSTRSQVRLGQVRDNVHYFNSLRGKIASPQIHEVHFDLHRAPHSNGHRSATPSPLRYRASEHELPRHILCPSSGSCDATSGVTGRIYSCVPPLENGTERDNTDPCVATHGGQRSAQERDGSSRVYHDDHAEHIRNVVKSPTKPAYNFHHTASGADTEFGNDVSTSTGPVHSLHRHDRPHIFPRVPNSGDSTLRTSVYGSRQFELVRAFGEYCPYRTQRPYPIWLAELEQKFVFDGVDNDQDRINLLSAKLPFLELKLAHALIPGYGERSISYSEFRTATVLQCDPTGTRCGGWGNLLR